jgi:tetratricopeptide (TPR) repeat protein
VSPIRLERQDDDLALVFRLQHIISGAIRFARPKYAHVVKIDNWFGPCWRCFAGSPNGKDLHPEDRLAVPPFAPNRVLSEATYRREGNTLKRIKPRTLHDTPIRPSLAMPFFLDERTPSGLFVWYSGNTASQDRASLMVYEVEKTDEQRAWYAEFQRRAGTWTIATTVATSVAELSELETAYANRLAPLVEHADDKQRVMLRGLRDRADDAVHSTDVAQAMVLIDRYRSIKPDDVWIRLLHARNLADRRLFEDAEQEFRAIERHSSEDDWRTVWLSQWADFSNKRGDLPASEAAYREFASLVPNETSPWILLGSCLATQGKLDQAETIHRHASQLPGDPDEAYLNLGYVLRATGRLEEAATAFERALQLCPDYPEASSALADVRAAMELRRRDR